MARRMKEMDEKLKDVVGMKNLKETLRGYLRDSLADRLRRDIGAQQGFKRPIMVFKGSPGTGKTSIAKLVSGMVYSHIVTFLRDVHNILYFYYITVTWFLMLSNV